jgi:hypothetical protein
MSPWRSDRRHRSALQGAILSDAEEEGISDLRGALVDGGSGAPLPYAVVRLQSTATSQAVEVPPGKNVFVELRVAPQAVEVEGLVVTARPAAEMAQRITPFRWNVVAGETMALEAKRGALPYETLRRAAPGIRVTETYRDGGPPLLCIESTRGMQTFLGGGVRHRGPHGQRRRGGVHARQGTLRVQEAGRPALTAELAGRRSTRRES